MSSQLKIKLTQDSEYQKFRNIVRTVQSTTHIDKTLKEAEFLHASRKARSLHAHRLSPNALQEAILNELGNRSRLVELRTLMSRQYELLVTSIETIRRHVRVRYSEDVGALAKVQADKSRVVDQLLATPIKMKSELASAFDIMDMYIKDIDSASYALRNNVDLLKMILDRRSTESI